MSIQVDEAATQLKPCCFCGSHAVGIVAWQGRGYSIYCQHKTSCILCGSGIIDICYSRVEDLVLAWNTREQPKRVVHYQGASEPTAVCADASTTEVTADWSKVTCTSCLKRQSTNTHWAITACGNSAHESAPVSELYPLCGSMAKYPRFVFNWDEVTCRDCRQKMAKPQVARGLAPVAKPLTHMRGRGDTTTLCRVSVNKHQIVASWARVNCPDCLTNSVIHFSKDMNCGVPRGVCGAVLSQATVHFRATDSWDKVTCKNCLRRHGR